MNLFFVLFTGAVVLLWLPARQYSFIAQYAWPVVFALALALGLFAGDLTWVALLPVAAFGFICFSFERTRGLWRASLGIALVGVGLGLGTHGFPGFHPTVIVDHVRLAPDSVTYSLYFTIDKAVVGLFILAGLHPLLRKRSDVVEMLWQLLPIAVVTLAGVFAMSLATGYVRVDVKVPDFLGYWLWGNLFLTCMAEEALFRGFLQHQLAGLWATRRYGPVAALLICAVLFGVAHAAGGWTYVLLATLAGLGYGWAYHRTQRIEASILLHLLVNTVHLIFFSYPALAK